MNLRQRLKNADRSASQKKKPPDQDALSFETVGTQRSQNTLSKEIDPLKQIEDSTRERAETQQARDNEAFRSLLTQIGSTVFEPRYLNHEELTDDHYNTPFFKRLQNFGVHVYQKGDSVEHPLAQQDQCRYFYLNDSTAAKLLQQINGINWEYLETPLDYIKELKAALNEKNNEDIWKLFLNPCVNINGTQDAIFRTLLLARDFQIHIFKILLQKFHAVAQKNRSNENNAAFELGELIIRQLRYMIQVFDTEKMFCFAKDYLTDKGIASWNAVLRDQFIDVIPEIFTGTEFHSDIVEILEGFMFNKKWENQSSLQASCLKAISALHAPRLEQHMRETILENIMEFDIKNIPLAVDVALVSLNKMNFKDKVQSFSEFVQKLYKCLNLYQIEKIDSESESTNIMDKCLSETFENVAKFIRFNVDVSKRVLSSFFSNHMFNDHANAENFEEPYENVDDNDHTDRNLDDPFEPAEPGEIISDVSSKLFNVMDVMLLFHQFDAEGRSRNIIKCLDGCLNHDTFSSLNCSFEKVISFSTFATKFQTSLTKMARDFVANENPIMHKIGKTMYKCLLKNSAVDAVSVMRSLLSHFGDIDSETETSLSVLEDLTTLNDCLENKEVLRKMITDLFFEYCEQLSSTCYSKLIFIVFVINRNDKNRIDQINRKLNTFSDKSDCKRNILKIIGVLQFIRKLLVFPSGDKNDETITTELKNLQKFVQKTGNLISAFYLHLSELTEAVKSFNKSDALTTFGTLFMKHVREKVFTGKIDLSVDNEKSEFIPLIKAVKSFSSYCYSESDCWTEIMFILEAEIELFVYSGDKNGSCSYYFKAVEYLRNVLNIFSDYRGEDEKLKNDIKRLMAIKYDLLCNYENKMKNLLIDINEYLAPKLAHTSYHLKVFKEIPNEHDHKSVTGVSIDQFFWYLTPLHAMTIEKLLQIIPWTASEKRKNLIQLLEKLHFFLHQNLVKKSIKFPSGYNFKVGISPKLPISTYQEIAFTHDSVKNVVASLFLILHTLYSEAEITIKQSTSPLIFSSDFYDGLKFCVKCLKILFSCQNKGLNPVAPDHTFNEIVIQNLDSMVKQSNSKCTDFFWYFIKVLDVCPSLEIAAEILSCFKCLKGLDQQLQDALAAKSLFFLSKEWKDDDGNVAFDEKNGFIIASLYFNFRSASEKGIAIMWLFWHHLMELYPDEIKKKHNFEIGNCDPDPKEFVSHYEHVEIGCIKNFSPWYKLLFKWFVDASILRLSNPEMEKSEELVHAWKRHIETFYAMVCISKDSKLQTQLGVFTTLIKESTRFLSFMTRMNSSFLSFFKDDDTFALYYDQVIEQFHVTQAAIRMLVSLKELACWNQKLKSSLKQYPDLIKSIETFRQRVFAVMKAGEYQDAVKIGFMKPLNLMKGAKKRKSSDGNKSPIKKRRKSSAD